jgi:phosphoserine phosphatase
MNGQLAGDPPWLIRIFGHDRPRLTHELLALLDEAGAELEDMEQLVVRERLTLDVLVRLGAVSSPGGQQRIVQRVVDWGAGHRLSVSASQVESISSRAELPRHAVTVLGDRLPPAALAAVAEAIATSGGNIDRIVRLARTPVIAYDLTVIVDDPGRMRRALMEVAHDHHLDIAVQAGGLERRAKRLVVMDVDSTLIADEVIELLADEAGVGHQVVVITERAMAGELDFEESLRARVRLLAGLDTDAIERARRRIRLTPGARTFVATLRRLGAKVAIISGGFTPFTDWLQAELKLDHAYANVLEIRDGMLTGELLGDVVDRARKAALLTRIAADEGIPLSQTVAIGDGANDLDMLAAAGLGIAFNAKPIVRRQVGTTVSVPYLDAILFMLGLRGRDVDRAE